MVCVFLLLGFEWDFEGKSICGCPRLKKSVYLVAVTCLNAVSVGFVCV